MTISSVSELPAADAEDRLHLHERYLNRELSWLDFNDRVLQEANNASHPLLERVRFLSISDSNLAEFFCVRVAGLKAQVEAGLDAAGLDGMTAAEQLAEIDRQARLLVERQYQTWHRLTTDLAAEGIAIVDPPHLTHAEREYLDAFFPRDIFPALTPLAVDPAHPFPLIPNYGAAIALELHDPISGDHKFALVPLPHNLSRFVRLPARDRRRQRWIPIEAVVGLYFGQLFPNFEVKRHGWFAVLRDTEMEFTEGFPNLIEMFRTALKHRRRGNVIRLMCSHGMPPELRDFIIHALQAPEDDVYDLTGLPQLSDLSHLITGERPDLLFKPYSARFPERIREYRGDCFAAIGRKDIIVHHPYESFDVVVQFLRQAARDPDVLAIKQTLYRTSDHSSIVKALIEAAENGKSVTALVELKARFDEEHNIRFAHQMERAGVQVVYGFLELKTHAKLSMVVRREGRRVRTYVHFGTGNYHPVTAKIYTDLSYFTTDEALCRDAGRVFNFLTGYSVPNALEKLSISPVDLIDTIINRIEEEIGHVREGRPGSVWAKVNSLVEPRLIDALYRASQAGVSVDLIVRGICCLRPGVKGMSENIRVKSIIGRFLEHARIVCFGNGAPLPSPDARVYISSADWMPRNLFRRVETLVPIENPTVHAQVLEQIMVANLKDTDQSWTLHADGAWRRVVSDGEPFSAHHYFMTNPSLSGRGKALRVGRQVPHLVLDPQHQSGVQST